VVGAVGGQWVIKKNSSGRRRDEPDHIKKTERKCTAQVIKCHKAVKSLTAITWLATRFRLFVRLTWSLGKIASKSRLLKPG